MTKSRILFAAFATLTMTGVAQAATHPPKAQLSMAQARAIALRMAPGKVTEAKFEGKGAAGRYAFDIRQGKRIHEIGVAANSGKIVENKFESLKNPD
jgi:uncharacterized membrane protein YkoI